MDSLIAAAARALAQGDPLAALDRVALREDPPALALRGIAMAQLGELARAHELLLRARRGFAPHEAMSRARCAVAAAEVSLARRELSGIDEREPIAAALEAHGDRVNAAQWRLIQVRRSLLLGRLAEARDGLALLDVESMPFALQAVAALASAELAMRCLRTGEALAALDRAAEAARSAGIPALQAEVADARAALQRPAARCLRAGSSAAQALRLGEVEALLQSGALVVDACRHVVQVGDARLPLARRPVLFALVRALAEAGAAGMGRQALIETAFRVRTPDETLRARLRVEIGRLRALAKPLLAIDATASGYALVPRGDRPVTVLLPPVEGDQGALLALLADGAAWSTSALALALGASQRTVQRELADLEAARRVRSIGRTRAQRWLAAPGVGFTTILLLPDSAPPA